MTFIVRLFVNAVAIWVATLIVPGLEVVPAGRASTTVLTTLGVALVFGLVNAVIRPVVALISLPLYVLTLGLFTLVVNGLMLALTAWITELTDYGLRIDDFWAALLGGFTVSVVSFLLSLYLLSEVERRAAARATSGAPAA